MMDNKRYFATPEEILIRKDDLFSQSRYFAEYVNNFSAYLQKKRDNQKEEPDYHDREGINEMRDFLEQARKGLTFDYEKADEAERQTYAIIYGKAFEKVKLLTHNQNDRENIALVITDLSELVNAVWLQKPVPAETLDFYINIMTTFEKAVNPDANWYTKGKTVG